MENQPTKTSNIIKILLIVVALAVTLLIALSVFAWWRMMGHHYTDKDETEAITKEMKTRWEIAEEERKKKEMANRPNEQEKAYAEMDKVESMNSEELRKAEIALENGIKIEDEQNDFFIETEENPKEKNYNNPKPYQLPYLDYKSFQMGADGENIYFKHQLYGIIPTEKPKPEGDLLHDFVIQVDDLSVVGKEKYISLFVDGIRFDLEDYKNIFSHYAFIDWTAEKQTFEEQKQTAAEKAGDKKFIGGAGPELDGVGKVAGGPGYDYIMSSFPLDKSNLKYGQKVVFRISVESGSDNWHHATIDEVLGTPGSKFGKQVVYVIGGNKYELISPQK